MPHEHMKPAHTPIKPYWQAEAKTEDDRPPWSWVISAYLIANLILIVIVIMAVWS